MTDPRKPALGTLERLVLEILLVQPTCTMADMPDGVTEGQLEHAKANLAAGNYERQPKELH